MVEYILRYMDVGGSVLIFKLFVIEGEVYNGVFIKMIRFVVEGIFFLIEVFSYVLSYSNFLFFCGIFL